MRVLAAKLADSQLLRRGQMLYQRNLEDWNLPLSKLDKLVSGVWLILKDYSTGAFPPAPPTQAEAHQAESDYMLTVSQRGFDPVKLAELQIRKPFWFGHGVRDYLGSFVRLAGSLEELGVQPPARLLEVGCGNGWMCEFFAQMGYEVVGSSIAEPEMALARQRLAALQSKGAHPKLEFLTSPMEAVHQNLPPGARFDAVFVHEALHHSYDWTQSIRAVSAVLKPGGWFLLCNEPNLLHTFKAYRVARLSNTHEVGIRRSWLVRTLRDAGFGQVRNLGSPWHFWIRNHWLAARKRADPSPL